MYMCSDKLSCSNAACSKVIVDRKEPLIPIAVAAVLAHSHWVSQDMKKQSVHQASQKSKNEREQDKMSGTPTEPPHYTTAIQRFVHVPILPLSNTSSISSPSIVGPNPVCCTFCPPNILSKGRATHP